MIGGSEPHQLAYDQIIQDYCAKAATPTYKLDYEASITVNAGDLRRHVDAEGFALNYWSNYMNPGGGTLIRV